MEKNRREFIQGSLAAVAALYSGNAIGVREAVGNDIYGAVPEGWERIGNYNIRYHKGEEPITINGVQIGNDDWVTIAKPINDETMVYAPRRIVRNNGAFVGLGTGEPGNIGNYEVRAFNSYDDNPLQIEFQGSAWYGGFRMSPESTDDYHNVQIGVGNPIELGDNPIKVPSAVRVTNLPVTNALREQLPESMSRRQGLPLVTLFGNAAVRSGPLEVTVHNIAEMHEHVRSSRGRERAARPLIVPEVRQNGFTGSGYLFTPEGTMGVINDPRLTHEYAPVFEGCDLSATGISVLNVEE